MIVFEVCPVRDNVRASAQVTLEKKAGDKWLVEKQWMVTSGSASSKRTLVVCDGERLVFEQVPDREVVYDADNNLVTTRKSEESEDAV